MTNPSNSSDPMTPADRLSALKDSGAIQSGHFVLTSGKHSDAYVQCARILEDPILTTRLAQAGVSELGAERVDLVAAPAVGGIIFGFAVAQALGVKFIFSEREAGAMRFRRSFEVPAGARVLVVEDVVTTGGSVAEVIDLVIAAGGVPVRVLSIIDRGGERKFDLPLTALVQLKVDAWDPDVCSLCASGESITSPGSRRLAR